MVPPLASHFAVLAEEPELCLLDILCRPTHTSVDVGANLGIFSHALRRLSSEVWAVEPHPDLAARLRRAFGSSVHVEELALSDREGEADLQVPSRAGAEVDTRSSLETDANPGYDARSVPVTIERLDTLPCGPIGFLKIDVEGHELSVLRGGQDRLRRERPRLVVEIEERHRKNSTVEAFTLMADLGYAGFFVDGQTLRSADDFDAAIHQQGGGAKLPGQRRTARYINNFLFIPEEEVSTLQPQLAQRVRTLSLRGRISASLQLALRRA